MRTITRILAILCVSLAMFVQPASAQDYFTDTFQQLASPSGVEHNGFWKEMYYANNSGAYKGFTYWPYNNLSSYASDAVSYVNAAKPTYTSNISAAGDENSADLYMYVTYCPGEPSAYGCFITTQWTYITSQWSVYTWSKASIYIKPNDNNSNSLSMHYLSISR